MTIKEGNYSNTLQKSFLKSIVLYQYRITYYKRKLKYPKRKITTHPKSITYHHIYL